MAEIAFDASAFQPAVFIGDHTGIAHFASGGRDGRYGGDRKTGSRNFCFQKEVPYVCPGICHAVADRLGRVDNASAAYGENEIHAFVSAQFDPFADFAKTGIRHNASQSNKIDAGVGETFFDLIQKS